MDKGHCYMDFSPWILFTDIGLIALLLIVGTIIRAKVGFVQRMFLPASIMAIICADTGAERNRDFAVL